MSMWPSLPPTSLWPLALRHSLAMAAAGDDDRLVRVVVLMRHGARAPSKDAFKPFSPHPAVKAQWTLPSGDVMLEQLTSTGVKQCQTLGTEMRKWFAEGGRYGGLSATAASAYKWRSSCSQRVLDSAEHFYRGFGLVPELQEYADGADRHMRQWKVGTYEKRVRKLAAGETFAEKAEEEKEFVSGLKKAFHLPDSYSSGHILFGVTYVKEMYECELYRPLALDEAMAEKEEKSLKKLEVVWRKLVSPSFLSDVDRLSRWCWSQRFFADDMVGDVGSNLFDEVFRDTFRALGDGDSDMEPVMIITAHDYTILALLASAGLREYPEEVVSFAGYVVVEFYEKEGTKEHYARIRLNPTPFSVASSEEEAKLSPHCASEALQEGSVIEIRHPGTGSTRWDMANLRLA